MFYLEMHDEIFHFEYVKILWNFGNISRPLFEYFKKCITKYFRPKNSL